MLTLALAADWGHYMLTGALCADRKSLWVRVRRVKKIPDSYGRGNTGHRPFRNKCALEEEEKEPAATYFRTQRALSSAQGSLASVFGMGTGISSPP